MIRRPTASLSLATTAVALLCATTSPAQAADATNALGLPSSLNLLVFGDFSATSSDVQGRVAIGGNAAFGNYSINTKGGGALYGGTGLAVGGHFDFGGGQIWGNTVVAGNLGTGSGSTFQGTVIAGGDLDAHGNWITAGSLTYGGTASHIADWQNPAPQKAAPGAAVDLGIDFAAERTRLAGLSQQLDALAGSGLVTSGNGGLALDAQGASLAVFDLQAADVSQNLTLAHLGADATVIINVHGADLDFTSHGYDGFTAGHVLFNLVDATDVSFAGGVAASFLAPGAAFSTTWGAIDGQVVAGSWTGSVQVNDAPFLGVLPAVPEPASIALWLAGLLSVGVAVKRRG